MLQCTRDAEHHARLESGRKYGQWIELHNHDFSGENLGNPKLTGTRLLMVKLNAADLRYINLSAKSVR